MRLRCTRLKGVACSQSAVCMTFCGRLSCTRRELAGAFGPWGGGQVHVINHHCIVLRPKKGIWTAPLLETALCLFKCCMSAQARSTWCPCNGVPAAQRSQLSRIPNCTPACSTEEPHTLLAIVATLDVLTAQMDMLSVYGCLSEVMLVCPCKPQPCLANRPTRWLSRPSQQRWRVPDPGISDSALAPLKGLRWVQLWSSAPRGCQEFAMLARPFTPVAQGHGQRTPSVALLLTSPSMKQHTVLGTMGDTSVGAATILFETWCWQQGQGIMCVSCPCTPEDRSVLTLAKA